MVQMLLNFNNYTAATLVSDIGFQNLDKSVETHQSNWKESVSKTYDKASLNKRLTQELFETAHEAELPFY